MLAAPMLVAGGTAAPAPPAQDDPPVRLWINNDRRFLPGDRAKVEVRAEDDSYLIVLHVAPDGYLRVLFPLDPDDDNFARGGKKYEVRGRGGREAFEADATGRGTVYAAVSRAPFRFDEFVVGDHWDYRALAPARLPREAEDELTELVRRMAQGSFDYDVLTYDVIERRYASSYHPGPSYYFPRHYDPWCDGFYSYRCSYYGYGSGISIGVFFGRPYRRHIFYDPFFYRPVYAYPVYVAPRRYFYDPYYRDPFFRHPHPRRHYAYAPYRLRTYDSHRFGGDYRYRFNDGYRDRRDGAGARAVNTVYLPERVGERRTLDTPPPRIIGQPSSEVPRRAVTGRTSDEPSRARQAPARGGETPRRGVDNQPRRTAGTPSRADERRPMMESRPVEPSREVRDDRPRESRPQIERAPAPRREARPSRRDDSPPPRAAPRPSSSGDRSWGRSGGGGGARSSGGSRPSGGGDRGSGGGRRR